MTLEEIDQRRLELYNYAHRLAFKHYICWGRIPDILRKAMEGTSSMEALAQFMKSNPYHKPAGTYNLSANKQKRADDD